MKSTMRAVIVCGLVFGAAGLVATAARAGMKSTYEVSVVGILMAPNNHQATRASGSVGSTRGSADGTQYIGCGTKADFNNGSILGTCWAKNTSGRRVECTMWSSGLGIEYINIMRSIGPQSYIEFTYAGLDNSGQCTSLYVENGSNLHPSVP
jgi:hypothetical protein